MFCCRLRDFPPKNIQPGILGPGPALPAQHAFRFMRMRLMPPMVYPFPDMQRFPFDASMMQLPLTSTTAALNGNVANIQHEIFCHKVSELC